MPRLRRWNTPGDVYHLISRFVDRHWFIESEVERAAYVRFLGDGVGESDWDCLAFAVMSNHIHLVVEAGQQPLSSWIRRVNAPFAQWMNARRERIGNVFCRGPKDFHVPDHEIARAVAYVHNNPVRAGVVRRARDSHWTSHRYYCGLEEPPEWLSVDKGLARAGFANATDLDSFVNSSSGSRREANVRALRHAIRNRGAIEMATPTIDERIAVPLLARPWAVIRLDPRRLVSVVAAVTGVPELDICSRRRERNIVEARRIAVCAANRLGLTTSDVAAAVGITQQAASKLWRSPRTREQERVIDEVVTLAERESCASCV